LVVEEQWSDQAVEFWDSSYPVAASILAYPEGCAALAAARRGGRLTKKEHALALADFDDVFADLISVGVQDGLTHRAGGHAEDHGLRGYDAVHLATALELGDEDVVMVTWDADLRRAAMEAGLGVVAG
jgi:predicted nucleic acid-binding protein